MRKKILDNIVTGLEAEVGLSSTVYTNLKIEDIQPQLPKTNTVNYFIGVTLERANNNLNEIGNFHPSGKSFDCFILVFIKNGDSNIGQTELDTVVRRVTKYLAKDIGNLAGLEVSEDGVIERVNSYNIVDYNYIFGEITNDEIAHSCAIRIEIKTEFIIN